MAEASPDATRQQIEADTSQLFMPYRGFCSRKGVEMTEVVLEDSDISKAINEYINLQQIHNFVLGASTRHALAKKFRHLDLAATMVKTAPEFCAVYVISKGKAVTVRSAKSPAPTSPPKADSTVPNNHPDPDDPSPLPLDQMKPTPREKPPAGGKPLPGHLHRESTDLDFQNADSNFKYGSDISMAHIPPSLSSDDSDDSSSLSSKRDLEAEMKRLKLELKQTMDLYSNAYR